MGIIDRLVNRKLIERLRTNIDRVAIELVTTPEGKMSIEKHKEDRLFIQYFGTGKKGEITRTSWGIVK